jgi:hypothetical protein
MNLSDSFKPILGLFDAHLDRERQRPSRRLGSKTPRQSHELIRARRKRARRARRVQHQKARR